MSSSYKAALGRAESSAAVLRSQFPKGLSDDSALLLRHLLAFVEFAAAVNSGGCLTCGLRADCELAEENVPCFSYELALALTKEGPPEAGKEPQAPPASFTIPPLF